MTNGAKKTVGILLFVVYFVGSVYSLPSRVFNILGNEVSWEIMEFYTYILSEIEKWALAIILGIAFYFSGICYRRYRSVDLVVPMILTGIIVIGEMIVGIGIKIYGFVQGVGEVGYAENDQIFLNFAPRDIALVVVSIMLCNYIACIKDNNKAVEEKYSGRYLPWLVMIMLIAAKIGIVWIYKLLSRTGTVLFASIFALETISFYFLSVKILLEVIIDFGLIFLLSSWDLKGNFAICIIMIFVSFITQFCFGFISNVVNIYRVVPKIQIAFMAIGALRYTLGFVLLSILSGVKKAVSGNK